MTGGPGVTTLHVALILDGTDICGVFIEPSRQRLSRSIARYAAEQAPFQLASADAERFNALISAGRDGEAVDLYFERGGRWAPERMIAQQCELFELSDSIEQTEE